ncbi:MAG: hypothetical protein JJE30_15375 [Desulfuromonadales bacterium]|nr:hypothetical protein [Desulfuromonadales bacterium]
MPAKRDPSHMAALLNVTETAGGFPFTRTYIFDLTSYKRKVAIFCLQYYCGALIALSNVKDVAEHQRCRGGDKIKSMLFMGAWND